MVVIGAKSRGPSLATARAPDGTASSTAAGQSPAARLDIGIRYLAWVSVTSGTAAVIEAQRPLVQHPCCCATMGADVQQIDNVNAASVTMAPIAVHRIHAQLFTGTT